MLSSKHKAFTQCCVNVGPTSSTLAQHWNSIGRMPRVCWVILIFSVLSLLRTRTPKVYRVLHVKLCFCRDRAMLTDKKQIFPCYNSSNDTEHLMGTKDSVHTVDGIHTTRAPIQATMIDVRRRTISDLECMEQLHKSDIVWYRKGHTKSSDLLHTK